MFRHFPVGEDWKVYIFYSFSKRRHCQLKMAAVFLQCCGSTLSTTKTMQSMQCVKFHQQLVWVIPCQQEGPRPLKWWAPNRRGVLRAWRRARAAAHCRSKLTPINLPSPTFSEPSNQSSYALVSDPTTQLFIAMCSLYLMKKLARRRQFDCSSHQIYMDYIHSMTHIVCMTGFIYISFPWYAIYTPKQILQTGKKVSRSRPSRKLLVLNRS